jgi:hypothetical protein
MTSARRSSPSSSLIGTESSKPLWSGCGFLGLGEHDVAIPYSQIRWVERPVTASSTSTTPTTTGAGSRTLEGQRGTFADRSSEGPRSYPDHGVLNMTKDQLKAAPAFAFSR